MEELIYRVLAIVVCLMSVLGIGVQHILLKTYILYRLKHSYNRWWVELGAPRLFQLSEFSDSFVMLSMEADKMEAIKARKDFTLYRSLQAYGKIERAVVYMVVITLTLILILYGIEFFGDLFTS